MHTLTPSGLTSILSSTVPLAPRDVPQQARAEAERAHIADEPPIWFGKSDSELVEALKNAFSIAIGERFKDSKATEIGNSILRSAAEARSKPDLGLDQPAPEVLGSVEDAKKAAEYVHLRAHVVQVLQSIEQAEKALTPREILKGVQLGDEEHSGLEPVITSHPTRTSHPDFARQLTGILELASKWEKLAAKPEKSDKDKTKMDSISGQLRTAAKSFCAIPALRPSKPDLLLENKELLLDKFPETVKATKHVGRVLNKPVTLRAWPAGDRDGHPDVAATITKRAMIARADRILKEYDWRLVKFSEIFFDSHAEFQQTEALQALAKEFDALPDEVKKRNIQKGQEENALCKAIGYIRARVQSTIADIHDEPSDSAKRYATTDELLHDIDVLRVALQYDVDARPDELPRYANTLENIKSRATSHGLHYAAMDLRQNSSVFSETVADLCQNSPVYSKIAKELCQNSPVFSKIVKNLYPEGHTPSYGELLEVERRLLEAEQNPEPKIELDAKLETLKAELNIESDDELKTKLKAELKAGRISILKDLLRDESPPHVEGGNYTYTTKREMELTTTALGMRSKISPDALACQIIANCESEEHMLQAMVKVKAAGGYDPKTGELILPIVPLFETIQDLERAPAIMESFFHILNELGVKLPENTQKIMVGYSDSNKDGGFLSSQNAVKNAKAQLAKVAEKSGRDLSIFDGNGGSEARGGGNQVLTIRARHPVGKKSEMTWQGEAYNNMVPSGKLGAANMAHQIAANAARRQNEPDIPEEHELIDNLAKLSDKRYRELHDERFVKVFKALSALFPVKELNAGSRPPSRNDEKDPMKWLGGVRAINHNIPTVAARMLFQSVAGFGTAVDDLIEQDPQAIEKLKKLYQEDLWFKSKMTDMELGFAKAHPGIAKQMFECLPQEVQKETKGFFDQLHADFQKGMKHFLAITDQTVLMEKRPEEKKLLDERLIVADANSALTIKLAQERKKNGPAVVTDKDLAVPLSGVLAAFQNAA